MQVRKALQKPAVVERATFPVFLERGDDPRANGVDFFKVRDGEHRHGIAVGEPLLCQVRQCLLIGPHLIFDQDANVPDRQTPLRLVDDRLLAIGVEAFGAELVIELLSGPFAAQPGDDRLPFAEECRPEGVEDEPLERLRDA